jgi:Spy/CpxP family protein refolding chaperone
MKMKLLITMMMLTATQFVPVGYADDQPGQGGGWKRHHREGFANLSADERQKLHAAHQKAVQDPAVRATHDKMRPARRDFRDATRSAMLKADPSIQPILDKMPKGEKDED